MEALLTYLKQTPSMPIYISQFECLSRRLKSLSKKYKLNYFLSRLKDDIQLPIHMLNTINLNTTFGLVKIQDEYVLSSIR